MVNLKETLDFLNPFSISPITDILGGGKNRSLFDKLFSVKTIAVLGIVFLILREVE